VRARRPDLRRTAKARRPSNVVATTSRFYDQALPIKHRRAESLSQSYEEEIEESYRNLEGDGLVFRKT